jgi:chlorobactene glucosyltransferase
MWTTEILGVVIAGWLALYVYWSWGMRSGVVIPREEPAPLQGLPKVSVLVAARNEQAKLGKFLTSVLSLDYPDYEVILVDDASTDGTGTLADTWATKPAAAGRLRVIHSEGPPAGWTGKMHALHLAEHEARGEWLLSCDADIELQPSALRDAFALAIRERSQLVSLAPTVELPSFWARVIGPAFALFMVTLYPLRRVNDPESKLAVATGAFMLMQREAFQALGGFASARQAVLDDRRIAQLFKQSGHRICVATSQGRVRTAFHTRFGEIWEGLRRCVFEGADFSVSKILLGIAGSFLMVVWPWLVLLTTLAAHPFGSVGIMALIACGLAGLAYGLALRGCEITWAYAPAFPLATLIYQGIALQAIYQGLRSHRVAWKGRGIPLSAPGRSPGRPAEAEASRSHEA